MYKSKLIDRLRLLEKDELRDFGQFIESPYYNKDEKAIKLFKYLKKHHPVFAGKQLDREYIATKLFPEWKAKQYKKISYLMTDLSQLVDDFITVRELENDTFEYRQFQLRAYKRRKGDWFFNQAAKKLKKDLDKTPERGVDYYFQNYRLNHEVYTHATTNRIQTRIQSLENTINNLDLFYFSSKLRYGSEVQLRQLLFSEKNDLILLDEILEAVNLTAFDNAIFVRVFAKLIQLCRTQDKIIYDEVKLLIINNFEQFNAIEQVDAINLINSFCLIEYNQGNTEYLPEIFEIHEFGLKHNIWIIDGRMRRAIFDNIVAIACNSKKFDWADTFIKRYARYIREDIAQDVLMLAKCRLEFSMGNFDKTLELIRDAELIDGRYQESAKIFQIRCYYELSDYHDTFYDACNAFAQYCRRNKLMSQPDKTSYLNFITFIKQLHEARYARNSIKIQLLEKLEKNALPYTGWLKEKIEQDVK